jgi:uncharacterized protein YndB with AHSA1/START domain
MHEIKKQILISAPAAEVWEHITNPKKIAGWLMPNDFEARVGKEFFMDCKGHEEVSCVVKEIVPLQRLVYSFKSRTTRVETLVTVTLAKEGKSTRVTLVHSGWDALPPDQRGIADTFGDGWGGFLEKLQQQLSVTKSR